MESKIYNKAIRKIAKIGMRDRIEIVPCRFGYEYLTVSCNDRIEREAVESVAKGIKGVKIDGFFPGIHDSIGVVEIHDEAEYNKCRIEIGKEAARVEDWWQRYHAADEGTRKLMACGKIQ